MINKAQKNLLGSLKLSLFDITPSNTDDVDWNEVAEEAKAQTVMGLISPVVPIHDESADQGRARYMQLLYEQDKLVKLLDNNNVPCVILKGCAAAVYYPKPYLRAMGDVDFLVPRNKFNDAVYLMEANGYIYDHGKDDSGNLREDERHIAYSKNGIMFELHHHFSSSGFDIDDILEDAIGKREYRLLNGYKVPMLPDLENGLVLLGHIHQHIKLNNIGLRRIIDWEMYLNSVINREKWKQEFAPIAKKIGLFDFAVNVTVLCEKYLGLTADLIQDNYRDEEAAENLIDIIMTNGNFGRKIMPHIPDNGEKFSSVAYYIKEQGLYSFLQEAGLSKWTLCKKYQWLKPFAFIYAFFRLLIKGATAAIHTKNVKKHIIDGKNKYDKYKKIGIRTKNQKP